jgi:hypothetical protein
VLRQENSEGPSQNLNCLYCKLWSTERIALDAVGSKWYYEEALDMLLIN